MEEILIPILVCVVLPITIVWIVSRTRQNETNKKAEIMLKAIESGAQVDPNYFKPSGKQAKKQTLLIKQDLLDKLTGACITGFIGLGFVTLGVIRAVNPSFGGGLWMCEWWLPAGGILLAVGLGLFISYYVGKNMLAKEIEAEERNLGAPKE